MSITHTISDFNDNSDTLTTEEYNQAMAELKALIDPAIEDVKAGRVSPADEAFARVFTTINERNKLNKAN